jgi:hypothetical protein
MGFLERLGLLVILSGALPAQQPAKSTEGPQPRPAFMDVTSALGVDFQYMASHTPRHYLPQTMGAGVALFDYDNDGRLDLFLVNGAPIKDPATKGTILQKTERLLESSLSPEAGRHFRGCYRKSWLAGSRVSGNQDVLIFALTLGPDAHE